MRWLVLVLLVSLAALLVASGGVAHHLWRARSRRAGERRNRPAPEEPDIESEEAR